MALTGLLEVTVKIGSLAIEDIRAARQINDLGFVVLVIAGIHDVDQFLPPRDRDKSIAYLAQDELAFLTAMLEVERAGKTKVVGLPFPQVLFDVFEPGPDRQPGGVQALLVDVDVELLLERVGEGRNAMVQRHGLHGEHGILQDHERGRSGWAGRGRTRGGGAFGRSKSIGGPEDAQPRMVVVKLADLNGQ